MNMIMISIAFLWLAVSLAFFLIARPEVIKVGRTRRVVYEYMVLFIAALLFPVLALSYGLWLCLEERKIEKRRSRG
jgi:hypothetical protein